MSQQLSLRQRNRLQAMRLVQSTAMDMFERDGYETTTIDRVAGACGVSPSTIYRHFTTKENVVLWDERAPIIDAELGKRLGVQPPVQAFRDAVVIALAEREDLQLFLRRLRLVYDEPSIWAAAALQDRTNRAALAGAIAVTAGRIHPTLIDESVAAVCLIALDIALEHWQRDASSASLSEIIDRSIHSVANAT